MLTVPNDMARRAEILKKDIFYNKPYAEMYRQLIQIGMDKFQKWQSKTVDVQENALENNSIKAYSKNEQKSSN